MSSKSESYFLNMDSNQPATKDVLNSDSEQMKNHDYAGDVALATASEAMGSVQDGNALLWETFANIFGSPSVKHEGEGHGGQPTSKEEQLAARDMPTARSKHSLGRVIRLIPIPI